MKFAPERLTVGRLMAIVGILAVVLAALMYRWENADIEQAMISRNLRETTSDDASARRWAAMELGSVRTTNHGPIVSALARLTLGDPHPQVRGVAVQGLARVLAVIAQRRREQEQAAALKTLTLPGSPPSPYPPLGDSGNEDEMVGVVFRALGDPQAEARRQAASALSDLLQRVRLSERLEAQAIPLINRSLADPDPGTRSAAVWSLVRLGTPPEEGRGRLIALLQHDPDQYVRLAAGGALNQVWSSPDLYAIILGRHAQATSPEEQTQLLWTLAGIAAPPPVELVPRLLLLQESVWSGSGIVPRILGKLDQKDFPQIGRLGELADAEFQQGHLLAWFQIVYAMGGINPFAPEAQAALLGPAEQILLERPLGGEWRSYLRALVGRYEAAASPLVPSFRAMLKSLEADDREIAATCLAWIGQPAFAAIPDLEALSRTDTSPTIRWALTQLRQLRSQ